MKRIWRSSEGPVYLGDGATITPFDWREVVIARRNAARKRTPPKRRT